LSGILIPLSRGIGSLFRSESIPLQSDFGEKGFEPLEQVATVEDVFSLLVEDLGPFASARSRSVRMES